MLDLIIRGGPMMVPLLACSLLALAVILDRLWFFFQLKPLPEESLRRILSWVEKGEVSLALQECEQSPSPQSAVLKAGLLELPSGLLPLERRMEEEALHWVWIMEHRLSWLDTIITAAPLLGLLGTVTGMIKAFRVLGTGGAEHPTVITGGVAEALVATAFGLAVAIVSLIAYNGFSEKVKAHLQRIEESALALRRVVAQRGNHLELS